ncbi:CIR protein PIR protein [Plasmodium vinckei petteri]|uniref:CIR protein PIR protein n=1 Tax=Plasmodium vinckei petteri TaxID=138298 RepID=A0A6V7SNK5_PLAVN|nr:CIR protein PIR protein [Plasmodium vinckei petteri]
MAKSDYSIEDLYKDINTIDGYFWSRNGGNVEFSSEPIHKYCHYGNTSGNCRNYLEMASSGAIYVLENLKKYNLEDDKLAEYAILWLRYKLNQKAPYFDTKLIDFYNNYIVKNKCYNEKIKGEGSPAYKDIIGKKKDLMDIEEMTKFSYPFKILLLLYDKNSKNISNCTNSDDAKKFADEFEKLNKDSNHIENSSYNKILSTVSDDYGNLKKKCDNFPPLTQLTPKKRLAQNPEATSSSSSISTTLIPALSVFSVIPVFLGIAYKYSLFGVDKLFQRQYLRTKLKNVKKKMKLNI